MSLVTAGGSSTKAVQQLLAALVASKPGGRIAELGTAFGDGAAAILGAMAADATLVTVEVEAERFAFARERLAGTRAEVIRGRWQDVLPGRAPFDLVFCDAGMTPDSLALAISMLAPGGVLVKDDLTPGMPIEGDFVREMLLLNADLLATEVLVTPAMAVIVATRR
jgi:predicted O-methyltransferase YrrM